MILCKDLNRHRLGNALFQIAFLKAQSLEYGFDLRLPDWKYKKYFQLKWEPDNDIKPTRVYKEENFDWYFVRQDAHLNDIDFRGYWQGEQRFADQWDKMKDEFRWDKEFLESIWERTDFRPGPQDWACHIRLTDYQSNPNYIQIPASYYITFFVAKPENSYYIFSDNIEEAKNRLGRWDNVIYVAGSTDIEDMALMSQFQNLIIANSTFSWWAAHLSTLYHDDVNVIRPDGLFTGELAKTCTGKDFYKPEWKIKPIHNIKIVKSDKIDLKDCTFVSVVKIDSQNRRDNLQLMLEFLLKYYATNIIIGENSTHECGWVAALPNTQYVYFDELDFHRTKFLNALIRMSETEIVVNHDVDVFIPPSQMEEAVKLIRSGFDFVYPFDGDFLRITRRHYPEFKANLDIKCLENKEIQGKNDNSVGGCVLLKKSEHFRVGGENEKYNKFGKEDISRHLRYKLFGKLIRVKGPLYHMEHIIGPDSTPNHDFKAINLGEIRKELLMTKEQLWDYIQSWPQTLKDGTL